MINGDTFANNCPAKRRIVHAGLAVPCQFFIWRRQVLSDITVELVLGERVGFIGPNGAGKTTLLGIVSGSLQPDSGSVQTLPGLRIGICGKPTQTLRMKTSKPSCGKHSPMCMHWKSSLNTFRK
jgi:ABC-type molybdenum transport system ATPase subunit/photorepair protein PhrA